MTSLALSTPPLRSSLEVLADDGVRLHVEIDEPQPRRDPRQGEGSPPRPTVVFCHGYTMDMRAWAFQREVCAQAGYRALAWDHRGHGASGSGESARYTIEQLGRDLAAVLSQVARSQPVVLVGHSMGGMAIMALAESFPDVVSSQVVGVAFVSTSAGDMTATTVLRGRLGAWASTRGAQVLSALAPHQHRVQRVWKAMPWIGNRAVAASFFGSLVPRSTARLTEEMMVRTDFSVTSDFVPGLREHDKKSAVHRFAGIPSLLLVGDRDVLTPAERSATVAEALPRAQHIVVTRAGHNITLEHPELVGDYIQQLVHRVEEAPQRTFSGLRVRSTDLRPGRGRPGPTLGSPR
ncbi:MAG: alpha/beta hydrolase [Ornithinimicrobium sp.]